MEMALVLPLLFLLVFGIIEFGFVFNRWITMTHSAREGVRQLAAGQPADVAEQRARDAAPDIGPNEVTCTAATPAPPSQVQMTCQTLYDLKLFVFNQDITLRSRARMSFMTWGAAMVAFPLPRPSAIAHEASV